MPFYFVSPSVVLHTSGHVTMWPFRCTNTAYVGLLVPASPLSCVTIWPLLIQLALVYDVGCWTEAEGFGAGLHAEGFPT